jgi:hypothetical protein
VSVFAQDNLIAVMAVAAVKADTNCLRVFDMGAFLETRNGRADWFALR